MQQVHESNQPKNIIDIIDQPLLESFLRGYNNYTLSGVAIYYLKNNNSNNITDEEIICINPCSGDLNNKKNYHPFCNYYRNICKLEDKCIQFDKKIVKKYYYEKNRLPLLYCCHMQMWDMAYPIWVNGSLYGVVFAGQVLIARQEKDINWKIEFKEISEFIDYDSIILDNEKTVHLNCISKLIDTINTQDISKKNELTNKAIDEITDRIVSLEELIKRFKDFIGFGNLAGELFNKMYQSKKNESDLLEQNTYSLFENECMNELAETRHNSIITWQCSLQKVLSKIQAKYYFIERIGIFHDQKDTKDDSKITFNLLSMNSSRWWDTRSFMIDLIQLKEISNNLNPTKLPPYLRLAVGENLGVKKNFVLYYHLSETTQICTLFILQVTDNCKYVDEKAKKNIVSLLSRISRLDEIVRLNLREIESHSTFEKHVELTRHDLRTSSQYIIGNIDKYDILLRRGSVPGSSELKAQRTIIDTAINEHTSRIEKLTANINNILVYKLESININDAIVKNIELFRATAENRGIKLFYLIKDFDESLKSAYVVCEHSELNRAIAALIDNAIKYSFDNRYITIIPSLQDGNFVFEIENYGIGIPDNKMDKIKLIGERGGVHDYRRNRAGTGMGIYIANQVFSDMLNGKVVYSSVINPKYKNKNISEYHNYITKVIVTIPIRVED
jgi:signal transduction histidine kinase/ligand-binding sensor protein